MLIDALKDLFTNNSKSKQRELDHAKLAEEALSSARIDLHTASEDLKASTKRSEVRFEESMKELRDVAREIARAAGHNNKQSRTGHP